MTVHALAIAPRFTERHLKVTGNYMPPRKGDSQYAPPKKTPWIQLKGQWLQQAGFEVDATVRVRVIDKCLVITPA